MEVTFLGHRISAAGSKLDPKIIEAVAKMKAPTLVKEVRRFLGVCGFYRKHALYFAKTDATLTSLIRTRTTFSWTEESQQSFEPWKSYLMDAPILLKVQIDKTFILSTDASNSHAGANLTIWYSPMAQTNQSVTSQKKKKKKKTCEVRYPTTDKEALAVILACWNFRHYLWGTPSTIVTVHQPITSIFKRKTKSTRV